MPTFVSAALISSEWNQTPSSSNKLCSDFSGNNDTQIRYNNDDDRFLFREDVDDTDESLFILTDKYEKIYKTVDCNLRTKKNVTDIIKNNSSRNLADLNKEIVSMIKADEDFRKMFV